MAKKKEVKTSEELVVELNELGIKQIKDMKDPEMSWFPLKSLTLTDLFGGGIPRGRIMEIYGTESGGKCLTKDTMIATQNGYKTIESIFKENNVNPSSTTKTVDKVFPLYNGNMELENTTAFTCNGKRKVYKVTTKSGSVIKGTANHPLRIMSDNGNHIWEIISSLKNGDYLISQRKEFFGNNKVDKNVSYLLGVLLADGCFQENRISFTNNKKGVTKDKKISEHIHSMNKTSLKEFIRGYMDCESYCDSTKGMEVSSASYDLIYGIKLLLSQFGIISFLKEKKVKGYEENKYWKLGITGDDFIKYINIIGTRSKKVKERYEKANHEVTNTNCNSIPYVNKLVDNLYMSGNVVQNMENRKIFETKQGYETVSYRRLKSILEKTSYCHVKDYLTDLYNENCFYDKIESIEYIDELPTFDFAMSNTHSFVANGIVSHNTTLATYLCGEVQRLGYTCGFVDTEHALDLDHAKDLGCNINDLFLTQTDTAEEACNALEMMCKAIPNCGIIVLDSVAQMSTQVEVDGNYGDSHMGVNARLMGELIRRITPIISNKKITIIFTNQIRMKLGVLFGSPETTPGGNALKFGASIRVDIRRREMVGDKERPIGIVSKIKIAKNKVGPPLRVADLTWFFKTGLDLTTELITFAEKYEIIEKAGSWYSYKGERIGQGSRKVKTYLEANPKIYKEIDKLTRKALKEQ